MSVKKISSEDVEVGMFISSLDRPWGETTFLFQGFQIRQQSEIKRLQKICNHVYIMLPDEEIVLDSRHSNLAPELVAYSEVGQEHYEVTTTIDEELKTARKSHKEISLMMLDIESSFHEDKELNVPELNKSIEVMVDSIARNPDAFIWLTRMKQFDSRIYRDSLSAAVWATSLGRELGLEREKLQALATGTLCMDIGKTALPIEILNKEGRLSDEEWVLVKSHVEHGVRILSNTADVTDDVLDIIRTHHERLDGSGYPAALKNNEIPLLGQIAGIIDFYVTVTTTRPYARAISSSNAIHVLYQQRGRYFSEALIDKFIQALSTYPTGALVELSNGEVGIIVSQNPGLRLHPNVVLLFDADKKKYDSYSKVSLADYTDRRSNYVVNVAKTLADGEYDFDIEALSL